jgi:plastocyanin
MGTVKIEGDVPQNEKIAMSADKKCPQDKDARAETYVVSDGGLKNVIVFLSSGVEAKKYPVPTQAVVIDQVGCKYVPHALSVQTGQEIKIKNSDDTGHNIHSLSMVNPTFNIGQALQGLENSVKLEKAESPFRVKCDVHSWMGNFVGVFDHPYHAVSGDGGKYAIKVPPGTYEVTAWHEKLGTQKGMVTVKEGSAMEHLDFTFKAEKK